MAPNPALPPILIADDDQDAVVLLRTRLTQGGVANPVTAFQAGPALIAHLEAAQAAFLKQHTMLPCVLFLDLGLRGMSGFELLTWIRQRKALRTLKVVIVSNSDVTADIERGYQLGADAYQIKYPSAETLALIVASPRSVPLE